MQDDIIFINHNTVFSFYNTQVFYLDKKDKGKIFVILDSNSSSAYESGYSFETFENILTKKNLSYIKIWDDRRVFFCSPKMFQYFKTYEEGMYTAHRGIAQRIDWRRFGSAYIQYFQSKELQIRDENPREIPLKEKEITREEVKPAEENTEKKPEKEIRIKVPKVTGIFDN